MPNIKSLLNAPITSIVAFMLFCLCNEWLFWDITREGQVKHPLSYSKAVKHAGIHWDHVVCSLKKKSSFFLKVYLSKTGQSCFAELLNNSSSSMLTCSLTVSLWQQSTFVLVQMCQYVKMDVLPTNKCFDLMSM